MKTLKKVSVKNLIVTDTLIIKDYDNVDNMIVALMENGDNVEKIVVIKESTINILDTIINVLKKHFPNFAKKEDIKILKEKINKDSYYVCDGHNRSYFLELLSKDIKAIEIESEEDLMNLPYSGMTLPRILHEMAFDSLRNNLIQSLISKISTKSWTLSTSPNPIPLTILDEILADKRIYKGKISNKHLKILNNYNK